MTTITSETFTKKDANEQLVNYRLIQYGDDAANQFIRHYKAFVNEPGTITCVIIHGGFFKDKYGVDNAAIDSIGPFLLKAGYDVCYMEYRRVGHRSGGWPNTNEDVIIALNTIATLDIDTSKIIIIGHSAGALVMTLIGLLIISIEIKGGTLALWASLMLSRLSFHPLMLIALAPIGDLVEGQNRRLASPHYFLPLKIPSIIAVGANDVDVPVDIVTSFAHRAIEAASESFTDQLRQASPSEACDRNEVIIPDVIIIENADHYDIVNANHAAWQQVFGALETKLNNLQARETISS